MFPDPTADLSRCGRGVIFGLMAGLAKAEVARMEMTAEDCSMLMICLLWDARRAFVD